MKKKATIFGAGVSGLVSAYEFLKKGWEVRNNTNKVGNQI